MRMMSIASGSSGNCIYIGSNKTHILIDDGISKKKVIEGLNKLDMTLEDIDAILVTHEHDDHIKGLGVLERAANISLYGSTGTIKSIKKNNRLGAVNEDIFHDFIAGSNFSIGDLNVKSVKISHDAADPVAYVVSDNKSKAGVITDLGFYSDEIVKDFSNLDTMLIEANHDVRMLMAGPYPYPLKQRILGETGHLSNESCGRLLGEILNDKITHVLLGHLSKENNFPDLAYETVRLEINLGDNDYNAGDFDIKVAKRDMPSDIIIF